MTQQKLLTVSVLSDRFTLVRLCDVLMQIRPLSIRCQSADPKMIVGLNSQAACPQPAHLTLLLQGKSFFLKFSIFSYGPAPKSIHPKIGSKSARYFPRYVGNC